jgi:hypothetical protein
VPLKLMRKFKSNGEGTTRWKETGRTENRTRRGEEGRYQHGEE